MNTFQRRVQAVVLALLAIVTGLSFLAVLATTKSNLLQQSEAQLVSATRVFDSAIGNRRNELATGVEILAADFGFKRAVATSDEATLHSALHNHGRRIDADAAMFFDRDGALVATTVTRAPGAGGAEFNGNNPIPADAVWGRTTSSIVLALDDTALQLVITPVLAPDIIGWVAMGFELDDALAQRIEALTNVQVTFAASRQSGAVFASTLPGGDRRAIAARRGALASSKAVTPIMLDSHEFLAIRHDLAGVPGGGISAILTMPMAVVLQSYTEVRTRLFYVLVLALLLSWAGAWLLANMIARPLRALAGAALRVSKGDYDGSVTIGGSTEIDQVSTAFNNMQRDIKQREQRIIYQAHHDALTDLPNRLLITDQLEQAIRRARRREGSFAVIMIDIDGFKDINDTLGHGVGDAVLVAVGQHLKGLARASDSVARLGGDEFVMLVDEATVTSARSLSTRIESAFEDPLPVDGAQIRVRLSGGIVAFPAHGETTEELMRRADIALYAAKANDKSNFAAYEMGRDEEHLRRLSLINDLRNALETDSLEVYYQPKVELDTDTICAAEALLRWQHPEFGFVSPEEFIPLAEQSGLVGRLTRHVLKRVLHRVRGWQDEGLALTVAVNLSAHDLLDDALPDVVATLLRENGVSPRSLILEVTESAVMKDVAHARGVMQRLRTQGIRLSIDDFGTGHASLAQLKRLPVDELKIDKSFIMDLPGNADDMVIVKATIDLAHNMGLSVTAEGVETLDSRELLRSYHCDVIQGYLISKPMCERDMSRWMSGHRNRLGRGAGVGAEPDSVCGLIDVLLPT